MSMDRFDRGTLSRRRFVQGLAAGGAVTAFRVFSSSDSSAPVLTGQAGSLVNLLDAVLVELQLEEVS